MALIRKIDKRILKIFRHVRISSYRKNRWSIRFLQFFSPDIFFLKKNGKKMLCFLKVTVTCLDFDLRQRNYESEYTLKWKCSNPETGKKHRVGNRDDRINRWLENGVFRMDDKFLFVVSLEASNPFNEGSISRVAELAPKISPK